MSRYEARQAYTAAMEAQRKTHGESLKVLPLAGSRLQMLANSDVRDPIQEVESALRELRILDTAE